MSSGPPKQCLQAVLTSSALSRTQAPDASTCTYVTDVLTYVLLTLCSYLTLSNAREKSQDSTLKLANQAPAGAARQAVIHA